MTLDEFFQGQEEARSIFESVVRAVENLDSVEMRVTKSQVAFRRRIAFAWVWTPSRHLRRPAAPLVLTIGLRFHHPSPRWKQVVEPHPGRFTHHLELHSPAEVDAEVCNWLRQAWLQAG